MLSFLPEKWIVALKNVGERVWELRIRVNAPIMVYTGNRSYYLGCNGLSKDTKSAFYVAKGDIEDVLLRVSGQALYRISDALKQGVVFTDQGVRIGVCGRTVLDEGRIISLTDITSLCIRLPYFCFGNAQKLYSFINREGKDCSVLVISPPAGGKTTLLRDFSMYFSNEWKKRVVLIDERMELAPLGKEFPCDVMRQCPKTVALSIALRTLNPEIIVCDELMNEGEFSAVERAINGGVSVYASCHASTVRQVVKIFPRISFVFERLILLSVSREGERMATVYNEDLHEMGGIIL